MADLNGERVFVGIPASGGLAVGAVAVERPASANTRQAGTPEQEREALAAALSAARDAIDALAAEEGDLAAEILEFQSALLEDDDLLAPVFDLIAAGRPSHDAWAAVLDGEVAEYRAGDDDYFKARADDLIDLKTRVLRGLLGGAVADQVAADAILIAQDLTPSRFLEIGRSKPLGVAIAGGSPTSHVAILARARGIPLVVGLAVDLDAVEDGAPAVLDAEAGRFVLDPNAATIAETDKRRQALAATAAEAAKLLDRPAITAGGERVELLINVDDPSLLDELDPVHCDGVGLTRTEFLFHGGALPGEEAQFDCYRRIVDWAAGRPVTVRTLDAGGDKPIDGVTPDGETNPFLGVRGVRLSLQQPEMFAVQLRALARAAALGPLKVMVPMVTVPLEMAEVRCLLDDVVAGLVRDGIDHARPALGMMVEVPAAALTAESFDVDFFSIGSNDLTQYVTACARDNAAVAPLADPRNPAVLELIRRTVEAGKANGAAVSLCGDMASDPALVAALLDCGLRALSVAPAQIGVVKLAIAKYSGAAGRHG